MMSSQVTKPSTSGPSNRTSGMFDWMRRIAKPDLRDGKSGTVLSKAKADQMSGNTMINMNNNIFSMLVKERPSNLVSDSCSPDRSVSVDKQNTETPRNNQAEDEVDQLKLSLGVAVAEPRGSSEPVDPVNGQEGSGQVVAFEKQFSSDNFACIDKGKRRYKKFSTLLLLEKKMNNNTSHELGKHCPSTARNFFPFFQKRDSLCRGCSSGTDRSLPCSVHNVETVRICTMVDSTEHRSRRVSQRAHQFQFTKETCVNLSRDHRCSPGKENFTAHVKEKTTGEFVRSSPVVGVSGSRGARIEPLQTTSDSAGTETCGTRLDDKTDGRDGATRMDYGMNQIVESGSKSRASSPPKKDHAMDETVDPNTENARSKRPIIEIPDTSEENPTLQPEGSSTDSKEVTASRVHSLNTKHIFPQHPSNSEFTPVSNDHDSRWIKRLRLTSANEYCIGTKASDIGEPSVHDKYGEFLRIMMNTSNIQTVDDATDQHKDSPKDMGGPLNGPRDGFSDAEYSCPWIRRWRRGPDLGPKLCLNKTEQPPPLLCGPHSLEFGVGELGKRQIPSIGAMALMGKTMNGLRSCEIKKKGSVFVWDTKKY